MSYDVRAYGLLTRALVADRLGRRDDAVRHYRLARRHLSARPEFTCFDPLRARVAAGLASPQTDAEIPYDPFLLRIPR